MTLGASERASISPVTAGRCTRRKVPGGSVQAMVAVVSAWVTVDAGRRAGGASMSGTATRFDSAALVPCRLTPTAT